MASIRTTDRRVERTRGLLHDALASLIHEKSYDAIVVKEILARANVGRSTFYAHFRDKDELLDSGIRDMLAERTPTPMGALAERVVRFSLPVLEHIERHKGPGTFGPGGGGQSIVHDRLRDIVAGLVADDLRRSRVSPARDVPPELVAEHVAATFVVTLEWWIGSGGEASARAVDERFRALVMPTLDALLGGDRPAR